MTGAVLALSPEGWADVARALAYLQVQQGRPLYPETRRLLDLAVKLARSGQSAGQEQPNGVDGSQVRENQGMSDGFISVEQAAEWTALSVSTIRRRIRDGGLPSYRVGRRRLLKGCEVMEYLNSRKEL